MQLKSVSAALALFSLLPLASCAAVLSGSETFVAPEWPQRPDYSADNAAQIAVQKFPSSVTMHRFAFGNAANGGRHNEAIMLASKLTRFGQTLPDAAFTYLSDHMAPAVLSELKQRSDINAATIERSNIAATIPTDVKLVEAIAMKDDGFYASSVVSGGIYFVKDGSASAWSVGEAGNRPSHLGIVRDEGRNILWAATAKVDQSPINNGHFSGMIGYELNTGQEVRRIAAPEAHNSSPGDIFLSAAGTVYMADSGNGAIYACNEDCSSLSVFLKPGILRSPQGMVLSRNGKALIVSDYSYGLARVDLFTRQVSQITAPAHTALDGVDGLYAYREYLVTVQTGHRPGIISALKVDASGSSVSCAHILEKAHPEWEEPTGGQVVGDGFFYNAGAQWPKFGEAGAVKEGETLNPTQIRYLDLRFTEAECR